MNFKTIYLLFGLLVVMLGVLGVVLYLGPEESKGVAYVFPPFGEKKLKPDDIDKVVVERKTPTAADLVFERDSAKNWKITSPRTLPTDSGVLGRMVDAITEAKIDDTVKPPSLKEAGLDSPSRIIKLTGTDSNGKAIDLTLSIGDTTLGDENAVIYCLSSLRPKTPLAVRKSDLASAMENLNYFRAKSLLGDNSTDIRAFKLIEEKKGKVDGKVEFRKEKETWRMVQPPYGDADVSDLLTSLTGLSVSYISEKDNDFVKDGVTKLAEYNLDPTKDDVLRIEVTRGDEKTPTTTTMLIGVGKKVGEKYYAALDEGKTKDVVKVPATSVEPFLKVLKDPSEKRNKNLVQLDSFKTPDALDVENTYGKLEFRKPDASKPWELYRDKTAATVDETEVRKLIDEVTKAKATSFIDPKRRKELGLEKPDAVVRVYADSLEKPDPKKPGKPVLKKDAKPVAELRFGNRERDSVAVERVWGADKTIVMAPVSLFEQVRKGPLGYFDKKLPPLYDSGLGEDNVTKVELTRNGETIEVVREKSTDPWKLVKPASLKGRNASLQVVRDILNELNNLTAKEIVAEKATPAELGKEYDLTKPAYKVVVTMTKDKKTTTHTYDFGKELAGKGMYLKRADKDTIYMVAPESLAVLKREMRDTTVFTFNPDDVVAVKFSGWKKLFGSVETLSAEKKDGKWIVKNPKDFNLDTTKLTTLLGGLSNLQAERFVASGKDLKLAEDALEIALTLADKKVLELTVGGLDGASYYATSNQLKGDVFLVGKDLFEEGARGGVTSASESGLIHVSGEGLRLAAFRRNA